MLVKLGSVWVDPDEVVFMENYEEEISIVMTHGATRSAGKIDEFASIINNAGQSFGGEDEKTKEE